MKKRNHLFIDTLLALMFLSGLALVSSDGEWMPWPNLAGIALLWGNSPIANARSRGPDTLSPAPSNRLPVAAITGHVPPRRRVMLEKTGKACWLPRACVEFYPGIVTVPDWLVRKINSRGAANNG